LIRAGSALLGAALQLLPASPSGSPTAASPAVPIGLRHLLQAYPEHLAAAEPQALLWRDGSRMPYDESGSMAPAAAPLDQASLRDQMAEAYPKGDAGLPPAPMADPGRARCPAFFCKMYGGSAREVEGHLVPVHWLPHHGGRILRVTRVNGVDRHVEAISRELEALPPALRRFVDHPAGAYLWRPIAGTRRPRAPAFGIALDINVQGSDYWRWAGPRPGYRNRIPLEIVRIFERHGFIWGGKWSHFDTMHFEYRPELLVD
jgi:hypothetical protein